MGTGTIDDYCRTAVADDGTIYFSYDRYQGKLKRKTLQNSRSEDWLGNSSGGYEDGPIATAKTGSGPI